MAQETVRPRPDPRPLVVASVVLGLGLGGFLDGIVMHQVLQWHHLMSEVTGDMGVLTRWDGFFHLATYALTVVGVGLLWRAWRRPDVPPSGRILLGGILAGAGVFNLVDSVLNHWILGVHHIWPEGPGGQFAWDFGFFVSGLLLLGVGWALVRSDEAYRESRRAPRGAGRPT